MFRLCIFVVVRVCELLGLFACLFSYVVCLLVFVMLSVFVRFRVFCLFCWHGVVLCFLLFVFGSVVFTLFECVFDLCMLFKIIRVNAMCVFCVWCASVFVLYDWRLCRVLSVVVHACMLCAWLCIAHGFYLLYV